MSPIFPSFPPKNSFFGKRSVLIDCSIVSSLWASWMVLAAAHFEFWEVQGISNTPRIISPLGKSHKMVFNLALCYSGFSSLSCFCLFLPYSLHFPSPFISLQRTFFWEAFGFDRFFIFFQFMGELDGSGSCSLWFLRRAGYLQYP